MNPMPASVLHIKNMVCQRCIKVVGEELESKGFKVSRVTLGEVVLDSKVEENDLKIIRDVLTENGFELIDDRKSQIINRIKTLIIELIHEDGEKPASVNLSDYLADAVGYDYSYLSNLFSSVEGLTIEKFMINQKIEKVKELLVYDELTLNEISYRLGYSSLQHLSNQFKKVTGLTPTHFREIGFDKRSPIDKI